MNLICITGSSGVGKTTMSRIIQTLFGSKKTLCLSGDDLHKWERNDSAWNSITHLNPEANDLELGYNHLVDLKNGIPIYRKLYNHDSGKFNDLVNIYPKENIIYEGLHALYHEPTLQLSDLNIFVDTDEELKKEWKLKRDIKKRGYKQSEVFAAMEARKNDERIYINPQKENADVIVKFARNNRSIGLQYICVTGKGETLMISVKKFYDSMNDFLRICRWLSLEPSLVQGRGGNISIKSDNKMIIKSSGAKIEEINLYHGYCVLDYEPNDNFFDLKTESEYNSHIQEKNNSIDFRPSMETGFHVKIPNKYVIHTHPIHLNAILCSNEVNQILKELFRDMRYEFVSYTQPGLNLFRKIIPRQNADNIFFLQNHGLIIGSDSLDDAIQLTEFVDNKCKRWLSECIDPYIDSIEREVLPLFPDAAVFPEEMSITNNYIMKLIDSANLTPNFLNEQQIKLLCNMSAEKYRKALQ